MYHRKFDNEEVCSIKINTNVGGVSIDQDGFIYVSDFDAQQVVII